ncbi:MAG: hypothetical protein GX244_03565, partial [Firmicutes bacterium]|nr:hypothetical protein [Bacillota bacterium]
VERSQKVHGEAKAGDDPADMDVGSRPLTMDGNCRVGHRRPEQTVELYERNPELRPQQSLPHLRRAVKPASSEPWSKPQPSPPYFRLKLYQSCTRRGSSA